MPKTKPEAQPCPYMYGVVWPALEARAVAGKPDLTTAAIAARYYKGSIASARRALVAAYYMGKFQFYRQAGQVCWAPC